MQQQLATEIPRLLSSPVERGLDMCNCDRYRDPADVWWAGPRSSKLLYRVVHNSKEVLHVQFLLQRIDGGPHRELCVQCADTTRTSPVHTIPLPETCWIPTKYFTQQNYEDYNVWYSGQARKVDVRRARRR